MSPDKQVLHLTDGTVVFCTDTADELELEMFQRPAEEQRPRGAGVGASSPRRPLPIQRSPYIHIKGRESLDELARVLVKFLGRRDGRAFDDADAGTSGQVLVHGPRWTDPKE